jgi:hypothetical protein
MRDASFMASGLQRQLEELAELRDVIVPAEPCEAVPQCRLVAGEHLAKGGGFHLLNNISRAR